jgi:hypothetical protein
MAVTAGKVEANLSVDHLSGSPLCIGDRHSLFDQSGIDRHAVGAKIAGELLCITLGSLDQARHVALDAWKTHAGVRRIVLDLSLLKMAFLALRARGLFSCRTQLHDASVRVMTVYALQGEVLPLVQVAVLLVVSDKAVCNVEACFIPTQVAGGAKLGVALDLHLVTCRVGHM